MVGYFLFLVGHLKRISEEEKSIYSWTHILAGFLISILREVKSGCLRKKLSIQSVNLLVAIGEFKQNY